MTIEIKTVLDARLIAPSPDAFPLERIDQIAEWSGKMSPGVRARVLLALLSVNTSLAFSATCADSIANMVNWQSLLTTLMTNTQMGPHIVATASRVLHRCMPEHPLAALYGTTVRVARIYDALDDGTAVRVSQAMWRNVGEGACWLVGLADPIGQCADASATFEGNEVVINPGHADWLERNRLACPAFLAIAI